MSNPNQFPIYIVSKGRADSRLTAKSLEAMRLDYQIVVEEQEVGEYAKVIDNRKIIILDKKYQDDYETCDFLGNSKSKGPGPARNFVWDHAIKNGFSWHWVMDDNINGFYRLNDNLKVQSKSGLIFKAMEDFCLRYKNVGMAGPNYFMFAFRKSVMPPFVLNTRIYSCNLMRNDIEFRWRGRYNEDTDLSLNILKAGYCTIQFNAFLQKKVRTQVLKGGNTDAFYSKEGTLPKSEILVKMHPDVAKVVYKFKRWHHYVDYSPFKNLKLEKKDNLKIESGINNYNMKLVKIKQSQVE